jgi:hypothetical protein
VNFILGTIAPVREIVIVIADLYLPSEGGERLASGATPGLEHLGRFGDRSVLERGWRQWLARWLDRDDLEQAAPASIAAAALEGAGPRTEKDQQPTAWIATPVHLIAGLTSVHLDRRSILRLPRTELECLASDFRSTFEGSGFRLEPIGSGDFLMFGPSMEPALTAEPARSLASAVVEVLPRGPGAAVLRRLGAEIEMWLHEHPLNLLRGKRGEPPVTALWLWGGGPAVLPRAECTATGHQKASAGKQRALTFGTDAYLTGLSYLHGAESRPLPDQVEEVFGYPDAGRAVLVVEVARVLHSNPRWTLFDALAELDRRFISPALQALHRGEVESVVLVANDRRLLVRPSDRLKLWRRPRLGLEGLQ